MVSKATNATGSMARRTHTMLGMGISAYSKWMCLQSSVIKISLNGKVVAAVTVIVILYLPAEPSSGSSWRLVTPQVLHIQK